MVDAAVSSRISQDQSIATVWLLSSLGHTHSVSVKKREILKLSIPLTCRILAENQVSMPLRHTGQLLFGMTVCYERKTGFILADVRSLRDSLQRQWIGLKPVKRLDKKLEGQVMADTEVNFLQDDPNLDLMLQLKAGANLDFLYDNDETESGEDKVSAVSDKNAIRQDDMWKEIDGAEGLYSGGRNSGLQTRFDEEADDLPSIDAELNFRLDDMLTDNESEVANLSAVHSDLGLNYENENRNVLDLELPIFEENEELSSSKRQRDDDSSSSHGDSCAGHLKKRRVNGDLLQNIKSDDMIGLLTDTLRSNHEHYLDYMKKLHAKRTTKGKQQISNWTQLFGDDEPRHLLSMYTDIFQPFSSLNFPVGRRGRTVHSTGETSRSSSVLSVEHGRRLDFSNLSNPAESNRLNLYNTFPEQIEEYPEYLDSINEDPQLMDLDIPPSSFGRNTNRNWTADSEQFDALRSYTHRRNAGIRSESIPRSIASNSDSFSQTYNEHQQSLIHDRQTEKFYSYIVERSNLIGKTTTTFPMYSKKFLFEDLIPGKLSEEEDEEVRAVTKRIASNAFLSLLQLSTMGKIKLDSYDVLGDPFKLLNGDDIIIYC